MRRNVFLLLVMTCLSVQAFALKNDRALPATIIADHATYNGRTRIGKLTGKVTVKQGSTRLFADTLLIYRNKQGKTTKIVALGNPARFSTLPDGRKKKLYARAKKLIYWPARQSIVLEGNGRLTQAGNHFQGGKLTYHIKNQSIDAKPKKGGRTVIVVQPQSGLLKKR